MPDDPARAMDALINRVHAAVTGASDLADAGPAVGEAADGMVRAELTGGRLSTLHVDPRMLRGPLEDLVDHVRTAVNAALDAQPTADATPMLAQLRQVQEESVHQMANLTAMFSTALAAATPSGPAAPPATGGRTEDDA